MTVFRRVLAVTLLLAAGTPLAQDVKLSVEVRGDGVGDDEAVVWLLPASGPDSVDGPPPDEVLRIDQRDQAFVPRILPVSVGQSVRFHNSDTFRHHVYSFSEARRFELPLFRAGESHAVQFDRPGVVVLGCNIHDHMVGYVVVADSRRVARVDGDGRAAFEVPAGSYRLRVWHPRLETPEQPIERSLELAGREQAETVRLSLEPPPPRREFSREALQGG